MSNLWAYDEATGSYNLTALCASTWESLLDAPGFYAGTIFNCSFSHSRYF